MVALVALVPLVAASVLGLVWSWIVWIVIGGIAGAIADRVIQGNRLGCLGNIVVGVIGGLAGGFVLDKVFNIQVSGVFWTFITALVGASLLLLIVGFLNGGRGIGRRTPTARRR
jgi:uncharacterized membrane protein YeaQ/YmgE (transglycosylase-associated protein family)